MKLASCKSALNPRWFTLLTVLRRCPGVGLTLCCFVVYSTRQFVLCLTVCYFVLVLFSPFSNAITSLGEERAYLREGRAAVCDCGTPWTFFFSYVTFLFFVFAFVIVCSSSLLRLVSPECCAS